MSDCCASTCEDKAETFKGECPVCRQTGLNVPIKTILQHIKNPWLYNLANEQYFFCRIENCDVVYFSKKSETINKSNMRTGIGFKEQSDEALICYCYGVNKAVASTDKKVKDFVVLQTRESNCSCETSNPSGRCCLKDFPKYS